MNRLKELLGKYKYLPLLLALAAVLILAPSGGNTRESSPGEESELLQTILSCSQGVGEARALISENGVVIVCTGADSAAVRLDILKAVKSYTGFGSDKITILMMGE